jgi:hypothetical protein
LKKISVITGRKNPVHAHPTGRIGPQFLSPARAWAGRRAFYSVKQLKTAFRAGLGPKKFRGLQDLRPRPSSKVRGWAWRGPGRAGLKMLRYSCRPRWVTDSQGTQMDSTTRSMACGTGGGRPPSTCQRCTRGTYRFILLVTACLPFF